MITHWSWRKVVFTAIGLFAGLVIILGIIGSIVEPTDPKVGEAEVTTNKPSEKTYLEGMRKTLDQLSTSLNKIGDMEIQIPSQASSTTWQSSFEQELTLFQNHIDSYTNLTPPSRFRKSHETTAKALMGYSNLITFYKGWLKDGAPPIRQQYGVNRAMLDFELEISNNLLLKAAELLSRERGAFKEQVPGKMDARVQYDPSGQELNITNLNNFSWHGLRVLVNGEYSATSLNQDLEFKTGRVISIQLVSLEDVNRRKFPSSTVPVKISLTSKSTWAGEYDLDKEVVFK